MSTPNTGSQTACIGIGSNLDNPAKQIGKAVNKLRQLPGCHLLAVSSLYRTEPYGPVEQPDFVNAAATLKTHWDGHRLLQWLQRIEAEMGRVRGGVRWGPRIIDLDLLVLGDTQISDSNLVIPHPGIAERNFVLLPLREIAPRLIIPGLGPLADIVVNESTPHIERIENRNRVH